MTREPVVHPDFSALEATLHERVADGTELGVSLCVIHDDEVLVDTWAGWADRDRTVAWTADTITPVWSISKVMTNLALLLLVDRGLVELDAPVARYWPEFAQGGKDAVTVAHLVSHSSGVPAWTPGFAAEQLYDWDAAVADLAAQEPWWEPGTASGYHLLNQGHLVGEVIRRVTGQLPGDVIRAEFGDVWDGGPGFHLGLPTEEWDHVSPVVAPRLPEVEPMAPDSVAWRALTQPFVHVRTSDSPEWKSAQIPGAGGFGHARGVAEIQSIVSHGGTRSGRRFLAAETVEQILTPRAEGVDLMLRVPVRFGAGWALPEPTMMPSAPAGRTCFWGGVGGSVVVNHLDSRTTVAYVMNRMIGEYAPGTRALRPCGDSRSDEYLALVWDALGVAHA